MKLSKQATAENWVLELTLAENRGVLFFFVFRFHPNVEFIDQMYWNVECSQTKLATCQNHRFHGLLGSLKMS